MNKVLVIICGLCLMTTLSFAADFTISLSDDQVEALEAKWDMTDITSGIQDNITNQADAYLHDRYDEALQQKTITEKKSFLPGFKL